MIDILPSRTAVKILLLAAGYFALALASRLLALPPGFASPIWPAAGLALGVLLVWGWRFWPGVFLGSLLFNGWQDFYANGTISLGVAAGIACGAALQGVVGAAVVRRFLDKPAPLSRAWDALRALLYGGPLACLISASIGVATLHWLARLPLVGLASQWLTWWVGDAIGALLFAPLTYLLLSRDRALAFRRVISIALPLLITAFAFVVVNIGFDRVEESTAHQKMALQAGKVMEAAALHLPERIDELNGVARLFSLQHQNTEDEFRIFVAPLLDLPSLVAVEWAPRVKQAGRAEFERNRQTTGAANYYFSDPGSVGPDGRLGVASERQEYFPIEYAMPVESNEMARRLDHAQDPLRQDAMVRAGERGGPAATVPLQLARTGEPGILVFYPVYSFGLDVAGNTVQARNRMLRGYIVAVFDLRKLMAGFERETQASKLLYRLTDRATGQPLVLGATLSATGGGPAWSSDLRFGDRQWRLELAPVPGYWQPKRSMTAQGLLVGSLMVVFLISLWVLNASARAMQLVLQIHGRRAAEQSLLALNANLEHEVTRRTAELAESERHFRTTFDIAAVGICHIAPDRSLLRVNARTCAITGYSEQELQQLKLRDITHPDDLELMVEPIDRLMRGEIENYSAEKRYIRKDGSQVWVRNSSSLVRSASGAVLYRVLIIEDITESKSAAQKREASELRYRNMFEHNPQPMWTYDPANLAITAVNNAACIHYGYTRNEFLGMSLRELRCPEDSEALKRDLAARAAGYAGARAVRLRRKDGSIVDVELISHDTLDEGKPRRLVLASDITERLRAKLLLSGQRDVLEQIAAGAPLQVTLDLLTRLIEKHTPGMLGSIMLVENNRVRTAVGAGLPAEYLKAIETVPFGEGVGSRGTAAFRGEPVIFDDIANDPLWADFRDLAQSHGLCACWLVPIFAAKNGNVLGTFAVYFREPRRPSPAERQIIEGLTHTAAIAITKEREQFALQASEERHRATFEHSALAISHVSSERRFLRVNSKMCEFTGYSEDELLHMGPAELTHPDDRDRDLEQKNRLISGGIQSYATEKRYCRKDGSILWANVSVSAVYDRNGVVDYTIGILQDVTQRKQAEAELQQQQELNRLLLENLTEGVVACDHEGRLVQFNKAARDWHGADPRDLPEEQWAEKFDLCAADGKTLLRTEEIPLVRAFNGEQVRNVPMSIARRGAAPRFVVASGAPIVDAEGNRLGAVVAMHDITERQRNERRFANLFEFAPDAIVMTNASGRIAQVNRRAESLFGWAREELLDQPVEMLIPEAVRGRHAALRRAFHNSTEPRAMGAGQANLRGLRKDGTTFPVDISLSPMESEDGPMVAASIRDISERVKADQAVRQALATLDATEDGVFIFDPDTLLFSYVNDGAVRQVGYSREELMDMMPVDIKPQFEEEEFRRMLLPLRSGQIKSHRRTTVHRHKDGHDVPVEINLQYLSPPGERARFIALVRDVSERHTTLRKLQLFNNIGEQTRTLVEPREIMAVITRLLGEHLGASRCAYASVDADADRFTIPTDYTNACASSAGEYKLELFGPMAVAAMRNRQTLVVRDVATDISGGEGVDMFNAIGITAIICCPLVKNGRLTAMMAVHQTTPRNWTAEEIAIVEDVVERCWATIERERALHDLRDAAEELSAANVAVERERSSLAVRVEERTAELTAMNQDLAQARDQAEAASRAKSTFLATVSHEIRTPMHGVLGAMELLERAGLEGQKGTLLSAAQRSARSLLDLLNDLLDMAKIEAGRIEILPAPITLESVVSQVVSTHLPNAITKGITLTSRVASTVPPCMEADVLRLRQILGNLVSNAIKFTTAGGVELIVDAESREGRTHRVKFIVRDTGAGIPADVLKTLFRPFEQGPADAARKTGGTGLGLAISRGLAERMGGAVRLDSVVGQGTTATLELVLTESDAPQPRTDRGEERQILADWQADKRFHSSTTNGPGILVVDDHPVNRMLLVKQLEQLSVRAEAVSDGVEALARLRNGRYLAVITDCEMPRMDGYKLTQAIRRGRDITDKDLPVIACTAHALPEVADRCRASGMNDVLTKPIELSALAGVLGKWLPIIDAQPGVEQPTPEQNETAVFDRTQLTAISGGANELEMELIAEFRADAAVVAADLAAAIRTENHVHCARIAHRGKGACMTFGAQKLARAYAQLEQHARQRASKALLQEAMRQVEREAHRLEQVLAELGAAVD